MKHCPICRKEQAVEQPPCLDGHEDCPEWVCVECGTAMFAGWHPAEAPKRSAAGPAA